MGKGCPRGLGAYLVGEVACVVVGERLGFEQLEEVCLHQALHKVDILERLDGLLADDVGDVDNLCQRGQAGLRGGLPGEKKERKRVRGWERTFSCRKRVRILISRSVLWQ